LCCFSQFNISAQQKDTAKQSKIKIIHADEGSPHPSIVNTHLLSGNVIFEHDSTKMYCDSAYFYLDSNAFEAFSNVRVNKGDSIKLTGDTLFYHGLDRTADLNGNIVFDDKKMHMVTESLHYDFNTEIGTYNTLATITSLEDKNTLTSKKGMYNGATKNMHFKDSVRLRNENYIMESDTLIYGMESKIATFHGPTNIISKDNTIYCEAGVYNTETEVSSLWNNANIITKEQTLGGDSIYYDREVGIGEVFGNVLMIDTTNKVTLTGNYGFHDELKDTTAIIGDAQMVQISEKDTLFLSAVYLTIKTDTLNENKKIKAYRDVKIFKSDFQGICDSLAYNDLDSMMKFFIDPVLWSGKNQITGKFIEAKTGNDQIDYLNVLKDAYIISQIDSVMYDQIKGRDINAYFKDGKINNVDVWGNGQTLYYIQNDDSLYLEANQAKCATIKIRFSEETIESIKFIDTPNAIYKSIPSLSENEKYFDGFKWRIAVKPEKSMFNTSFYQLAETSKVD
jgi:lipopolysaccharide export system protein LptA